MSFAPISGHVNDTNARLSSTATKTDCVGSIWSAAVRRRWREAFVEKHLQRRWET
jgi:hypothetical protein